MTSQGFKIENSRVDNSAIVNTINTLSPLTNGLAFNGVSNDNGVSPSETPLTPDQLQESAEGGPLGLGLLLKDEVQGTENSFVLPEPKAIQEALGLKKNNQQRLLTFYIVKKTGGKSFRLSAGTGITLENLGVAVSTQVTLFHAPASDTFLFDFQAKVLVTATEVATDQETVTFNVLKVGGSTLEIQVA